MIDLDENKTPEAIIAEAMVSAGAPLMHSRVEEAVAGALRKAGMLAEQSGQSDGMSGNAWIGLTLSGVAADLRAALATTGEGE